MEGRWAARRGAVIPREWIVLLEATDERGSSVIEVEALRRLMDAVSDGHVTALYNPRRYSLQFRVDSLTAAEALSAAVFRWNEAVTRLGLPGWDLARAEVLTPEEFDRELAAGMADESDEEARVAAGEGGDAGGSEVADDLLARAFQDSLTGLQTSELFRDRVRTALIGAPVGRSKHAVFVLDVDQFASVNRRWGHAIGDQVLVVLGKRLRHVAGPHAEIARYGGDAFALLVDDREPHELEELAQAVGRAIGEPVDCGTVVVSVTASTGLATGFDTTDGEEVIRHAETAMCAAKASGGNGHRWFEPGLTADVSRLDFDVDPAPDRLGYVLLLERAALAANECEDLREAAAVVLQQVCAHTGWLAGQLYEVCPRRNVASHRVWHATDPDRYDRLWDDGVEGLESADEVVQQVIATGKAVWSTDLAGDPSRRDARIGPELGINSAYGFPVMAGSTVVAVLEFFGRPAAPPDETLLEIMASAGTQLGRVVERERAQAALAESEARYRALCENLPVMVWRAGLDATCDMFNQHWLDFTGRTIEQELGNGWAEGVHPDDLDRCMAVYLAAFARRETFEMTYRLRRHDGEYRWILDRGGPLGEGDSFEGFVGGCIDITDDYEHQEITAVAEARWRALLQAAVQVVLLADRDGTLRAVLAPADPLPGWDLVPSRPQSVFDEVHPEDEPAVRKVFAEVAATPGSAQPLTCRGRAQDGSVHLFEGTVANLLDHPLIGAMVLTGREVTDRPVPQG